MNTANSFIKMFADFYGVMLFGPLKMGHHVQIQLYSIKCLNT